jgi:dipeptidyl aminopeptidase/acylaminoacyl peptidase
VRPWTPTLVLLASLALLPPDSLVAQAPRPMTFLDQQLLRQAGSIDFSPDGGHVLYTLSVPDWQAAKRFTDVHLVSTATGLPSTRQLTFTETRNESGPRWSRDGSAFVFSSDRDGDKTQLYWMRPDGGEARKITDHKDGVGTFAFTRDGRHLVFAAGKADEQQLWTLPVADITEAKATQLTRHATAIRDWALSHDGRRAFFLADDTATTSDRQRRELGFTARVRNQDVPLQHLWVIDVAGGAESRLTEGSESSVAAFTLSEDGRWAGLRTLPNNRYARTVNESRNFGDLQLLEIATKSVERLTENKDIAESNLSFAPDGRTIAYTAADDHVYFRANRVYTRAIDAKGGRWTKLGASFDGDVTIGWWSADSKTIYFNEGVRATNQVLALDVAANTVRQVTDLRASTSATRDPDSGRILITYTDPRTPTVHFTVDRADDLGNRARWRQLTDANPQVGELALGEQEELCWRSVDRKEACGVLTKPVGYRAGQRYPLIVAIHGGPQSADVLNFNGGTNSQVYAGDGYVVLRPNYRGSTNYGEAHKWGIVNDYFRKGYEDIMTGVDHLIAQGLVDGNQMGVLGWSAGGHWTNWIITHTTRFKAASSGAGTVNWISMYAQSDMQYVRAHYLGGKPPYEDFEAYWRQSPLRYISAVKTPTMIHVVDGDPRVPRPQSEELHMALKTLGVPTEFFVYPGSTHGIPDPRNQLLKATAEKAWMDQWIRGGRGFRWEDVVQTVQRGAAETRVTAQP